MRYRTHLATIAAAGLALTALSPAAAQAQGRGNGRGHGRPEASTTGVEAEVTASVSISLADRAIIQEFYATHTRQDVESLPPGIRRNLARGKPLPPGIAKKTLPSDLRSRLTVPERYEVVEVGLDVFLVEVATGIIHDVLMDVVR